MSGCPSNVVQAQLMTRHSRFVNLTPWLACAMLGTALLAGCAADDDEGDRTPITLTLEKIGSYDGAALGAAEITAFDARSKRLFVVNGANGTVDVLDLSTPSQPVRVGTLFVGALGAGVNSVAVHDGLVALAIEAAPKTSPGAVAFYNAATCGCCTRCGRRPARHADLHARRPPPAGGQRRRAQQLRPGRLGGPGRLDQRDHRQPRRHAQRGHGGLPRLQRSGRHAARPAACASSAQAPARRRIWSPSTSPSAKTASTAYVTLQENNAVAIVDVASRHGQRHQAAGHQGPQPRRHGLDASDEDGGSNTNSGTPAIKIGPQPVKGLYLPDAIARYTVDGKSYLVTANEGDARADWPGFNEETRVRAHCSAGLDPTVFANADKLILDSNLGRLRITSTPNGGSTGKNASGQCNELYSFGAARSPSGT
jgi:hypothetical protein